MQTALKTTLVLIPALVLTLAGSMDLYGGETAMSAKTVILETNQGVIEIELMPEVAPKACENFTKLVEKGYYNGLIFHRVIPEFMIQGGDPTGTGTGGESIWGKPFEDEVDVDVKFNKPGILAMANAGRNTNGSQFFITDAPTPWLDGKHSVFGRVIEGLEVVRQIAAAPRSPGDKPLKEIRMTTVTVSES